MRWPEGTEQLQVKLNPGGIAFFVHDAQILSFFIRYRDVDWDKWVGQKPAIGKPEDGMLYEFPLKQAEVISVFGKPDRIRERLEE